MIPHHEDVDVARERQRVFTGNVHNDMLTIENLTKVGVQLKVFILYSTSSVVPL